MRKVLSTAVALAALALCLTPAANAEDANFACAHWHYDPTPGYAGPLPAGIECRHMYAPAVTWTVPDDITEARFYVFGGGDPEAETAGGVVKATLALTPGSALTLEMGDEGEASAVSLEGLPLLVAGGSDGGEPNYVAPAASQVETQEPGAPKAKYWNEGRIVVEWFRQIEGPPDDQPTVQPDQPAVQPRQAEPEALPCIVPRLKGLKPAAARKVLAGANCTLGRVARQPAPRRRRGRILRQVPTAGASLPAGAAVEVVAGRRR